MAATSSPTSRRFPLLAKYEVVEELGHGGMATVYRAEDKRLGREVAIKVIHPHLRDSKEVQSCFFVEAKAVAKLRHANIVEVYDVSSEEEHEQYLVCELLRGRTLRKLLQQHGAIPPEVAASLGLELLAALGHAHGCGVVHRDVKPENVILEHVPLAHPASAAPMSAGPRSDGSKPPPSSEQPGDRVIVKLTDFGIAKLLDAQGVTSTGQVLGSPAHMAPEQIEGGEVDARADVFGIGVLLYECMVGHLPFEGNNPAQVLRRVLDGHYASAERERPEVGKSWSAVLDRALAREAKDRFANAAEMQSALAAELKRVGIANPRAELEAWFDNPEPYAKVHKKTMIAKLCDLGAKSRRAENVLLAAADYNRALAYAPDDPHLLRIVAGMHRAEARARLIRKLAPAVAGALALGVVAFFVTRAIRAHPTHEPRPDGTGSIALVRPDPPPVPSASAAPSAHPSASVAVIVPPPPRPTAPVNPAPAASTAAVRRTITLAKVRPFSGVQVAVDGEPAMEASGGKTVITLDEKPHVLLFTCIEDLCEQKKQDILAGDEDEAIEIELHIKPARFTLNADPSKSYVIKEKPTVPLPANVPVDVPMSHKTEKLHVKELVSGHEMEIELTAGQPARFTFTDAP